MSDKKRKKVAGPGLLQAVLGTGLKDDVVRKTGIMTIVLKGGLVVPGDAIAIEFPAPPLLPLEVV